MIVNHPDRVEAYGVLREASVGHWALDSGHGTVDLLRLLAPFYRRQVRYREWAAGLEPSYEEEARVAARLHPTDPTFKRSGFGLLNLPEPPRRVGVPLHVEVECLDADDPAALTFVDPFRQPQGRGLWFRDVGAEFTLDGHPALLDRLGERTNVWFVSRSDWVRQGRLGLQGGLLALDGSPLDDALPFWAEDAGSTILFEFVDLEPTV